MHWTSQCKSHTKDTRRISIRRVNMMLNQLTLAQKGIQRVSLADEAKSSNESKSKIMKLNLETSIRKILLLENLNGRMTTRVKSQST